jgi:hypothetical protein
MKRFLLSIALIVLSGFVLINCGDQIIQGGGGPGGNTPTPLVTPTPQPTITPAPFIGDDSLCDPGDTARISLANNATARFTLNDETCSPAKDNRDEEYTMILYNTTGSEIGFKINSPLDAEGFSNSAPKIFEDTQQNSIDPINKVVRQSMEIHNSPLNSEIIASPGINKPAMPYAAAVIGDVIEYKVRFNYDDPDIFHTNYAVLRGMGTHILVYVDADVPFEDGNPVHLKAADITTMVNVFENNIYPLETTLLGGTCGSFPDYSCPEPDVDGNGQVTVIISPVLNWIPSTAADPDHAVQPSVYVDTRNLEPFNENSNAGSNEQDIIFLYAPDEEGYFYSKRPVDYSDYINGGVFAWLAVGLEKLISYNMHVFLNVSLAEQDWIDYGLGGVLADLAGFNIWTDAVWNWLDAPAYESIKTVNEFGCSKAMAGPYLFMLYLLQSQVDETIEPTISDGVNPLLIDSDLGFMSSLMSSLTGEANLENAIDITFDAATETEFQALFKNWTVALTTSGTNNVDLQTSTTFKYYYVPSTDTASLDPALPDSRTFGPGIADRSGTETLSTRYGSSPWRVGIDLNNYNYSTLIENPHEFTYAPGNKLFGVAGPYTANFIRIAGMFEQVTDVVVTATSGALQGFVVRKRDLPAGGHPRVYSESVYGSLSQDPEILNDPAYPGPNPYWPVRLDYDYYAGTDGVIGQTLTIVGEIDKADSIVVWNSECRESIRQVPDFDKYQFTIPAAPADSGNLAIWIERQADSTSGSSNLNPMIAVVSWDDIPYPTGRYDYTSPDPTSPKYYSRPQYRYLTNRSYTDPAGNTYPRVSEDAVDVVSVGTNECASSSLAPDYVSPGSLPDGSAVFGYCADFGDWVNFGTGYDWATEGMPDKLFEREILKPVPTDPKVTYRDPDDPDYDPRSINSLTLDCYTGDDAIPPAPPAIVPTEPDDWLQADNLKIPTSFQEQILIEMSRDASTNTETDTLIVNRDSRDCDTCFKGTEYDSGNNIGGRSVVNKENGMMIGCSIVPPNPVSDCVFFDNDFNSEFIGLDDPGVWGLHASVDETQTIYNPTATDQFFMFLEPGKTYVILVAGIGGTTGKYELKLRKILPANIIRGEYEVTP